MARQSDLFAGQDWTVLYRAFSAINLAASDPATINKALREYVLNFYPEEFSDWVESSEFVAIIDLLAWLAGTLAYKTDLAARENFLDTAEARESIIRLARFLSYNPSRNRPARGILKVVAIRTDEDVSDSFGQSLANQTVKWNDNNDPDWFEKFIAILNAAMISTNPYGTPLKAGTLTGANAALYRLNNVLAQGDLSFMSTVAGQSMSFSIVNGDFEDGALIERTPNPNAALHLIGLQDGNGNASPRSGLFAFFKQGTSQFETFQITNPIENQTLDLSPINVTQDDIWVQTIDDDGSILTEWTKVPAIFSENITFTSTPRSERNIFSVVTKDNDQAMIRFSDGLFGNAPTGLIRVTYRTANGQSYTVRPADINSISFGIPYVSRNNAPRTLTLTFALQEAVTNSTARETEEDIRRRAPLVYATQNRMVSGEDYNTFPLQTNLAIKLKALNRVYSGHSRFTNLHDPTSQYSDVAVYGDDGSFFIEDRNAYVEVPLALNRTPRQMLDVHLQPLVKHPDVVKSIREWLMQETNATKTAANGIVWTRAADEFGTQSSTGYFSAENVLLRPGTAVLFEKSGVRRWAGIVEKRGAITTVPTSGLAGNITLSEAIASGSVIVRIVPGYASDIPATIAAQAAGTDYFFTNRVSFDLYYRMGALDIETGTPWMVNRANTSVPTTSGVSNRLVASVEYISGIWRITARGVRYVFESADTVQWYNSGRVTYDSDTGERKSDFVRVLRFNEDFHADVTGSRLRDDWDVSLRDLYAYSNGMYEPRRISFDLPDKDDDGVVDNPDTLERLMDVPGRIETTTLFWQRDASSMVETPVKTIIGCKGSSLPNVAPGTLTFAVNDVGFVQGSFFTWTGSSWSAITPLAATSYVARRGRGANVAKCWIDGTTVIAPRVDAIAYLWKHYAPADHRIDPAMTNVHDMFVLTTEYDTAMRDWISNGADPDNLPAAPTELDLRLAFAELEAYRMYSDQMVWRPVKYRLLFGPGADAELRAQIKIVKLANATMSDGEIRTRVVRAVNEYFAASRWEFGETFFYTELAAYLHQQLAGVIGSAVLVPVGSSSGVFGDGFEIKARSDEMFLSSLQVSDVVIITTNTDSALRIKR